MIVFLFHDIAGSFRRVNRDSYLIYIYIYISCICLYNVITTLLQFLKDVIDGDGQRLVTRRSKRKKHWAVWTVLHVSWGDTCIVSLHVSKKHDPTHKKSYTFCRLCITHFQLKCIKHNLYTHTNTKHMLTTDTFIFRWYVFSCCFCEAKMALLLTQPSGTTLTVAV